MGELCDSGKEIRRRAKMDVEAWRAGGRAERSWTRGVIFVMHIASVLYYHD